MASGFRSPLPWIGLSTVPSVVQGGFRTPLPGWNAGGTTATDQGGFRTPLPGWNAGGTTATDQGGYRGLLAFWGGGAASASATEDRSPWWSWWRDHAGWQSVAPSLAELVMAGTVIESVPGVVPDEQEIGELLLEAWGDDSVAGFAEATGTTVEQAEGLVRWMAREERSAMLIWRQTVLSNNEMIMILAMADI